MTVALCRSWEKQLHDALIKRPASVSASKLWKRVHAETGAGIESGRKIILCPGDYPVIQRWMNQNFGVDLRTESIPDSRIEAAKRGFHDEKLAKHGPFYGMGKVSRLRGSAITLNGQRDNQPAITVPPLPPEAALFVKLSSIDLSDVRSVILIENGDVFLHCHSIQFCEPMSDALAVYRGHSGDVVAVREWIKELPDTVKKIGFFDIDPAGIALSANYRLDGLLLPQDPLSADYLCSAHSDEVFHRQVASPSRLKACEKQLGQIPGLGAMLYKRMTAERIALTQEHLVAQEIKLSFFPFEPFTSVTATLP